VADFMGFRNLLRLRAGATASEGTGVVVEGDGLRLHGTAVGAVAAGAAVVAAIRPEALSVVEDTIEDGVVATVEVVEYRGREFAVEARTGSGIQLNIHTAVRSAPGDKITVTADPDHLLVFPDDGDGT
jgi:putative spermidine/putrescine transport system ATP-binding protein